MKILVTGSSGLPGNEVVRLLKERGIPCLGVDHPEFDPADVDSVRRCVEDYAPDAILHCAGYTDADKAESLPERCAEVNGFGALTVARAAVRAGAKMLYLSSAQVFPGTGDQPFAASDPLSWPPPFPNIPAASFIYSRITGAAFGSAIISIKILSAV